MAMTTAQIEEYIGNDALKGGQGSEKAEPSKETQSDSDKVEDKHSEENHTENHTEKHTEKEDTQDNKTRQKPVEHTHEEKVSYAFAKEKAKRKAMKTEYEARIAELEKALADKKTKADFGDDVDSYIDWKLETANKTNELGRLRTGLRDTEQADIVAENERRLAFSFNDPREQDEYRSLLNERGPMFLEALQKYDEDGVILDWLDSKEDYPRVLKALMTDKEALKSVFQHPDAAGRLVALDKLRTRLNGQDKKPVLPKLGRLSKSSDNRSNAHGIEYWNEYLKNHPRGR